MFFEIITTVASSGGGDPYQYHGNQDRAYTMKEFINANKGLTRNEIVNQLENRSKTFMNSQQGGPSMRYVINPHDGKVLDMRHMLIVGKNPPCGWKFSRNWTMDKRTSKRNEPSGFLFQWCWLPVLYAIQFTTKINCTTNFYRPIT